METKTTSDQSALLGVVLAGTVSVMLEEGPFVIWSSIIGSLLLSILIAYDNEKERTIRKCIAFGSVSSFCFLMVVFGIWHFVRPDFVDSLFNEKITKRNYEIACVIFWCFFSVILTIGRKQCWLKRIVSKQT